jgi:hypothetical protein
MNSRFVFYVLTCGPLVLALAAWLKVYWARRKQAPHGFGLLALGFASANALLAAGTFLYYELRPPAHFVPPWEDPEVLQLAILGFLAPIAMVLGFVAAVLGAPKWLIGIVEIASLPLLWVGIVAGMAV